MRALRPSLAVAAILSVVLLTACHPETTQEDPPSATPTSTPSSSPTASAAPLAPDALLALVGTVTSESGAALELSLVVHSAMAGTDPAAAARVAAIAGWCTDEMDADTLKQGYSIVQIDYRATLVGSTAWPSNLPIELLPTAQDAALASSGDVHQVEILSQPAQPGDYVPHCQQPAFLDGPGSGSTYVALAGDATDSPPFTRWADFHFGFDTENAQGSASPSLATFTGCSATVTPLASTLGYPSSTWAQEFKETHCIVGGATP
jgi:hypothetical protein